MQKLPPIPSSKEAFNYQLDAGGHRGTRAIQRLVEYAPASGGLALWMQHRDVNQMPARMHFINTDNRNRDEASRRKPWIIANDGSTLFYGPRFNDRSLEEQTGLVAHQVLHVALRHVDREQQLRSRLGQIDSELFAVCADAIVNSALSHLTWLQLPQGSVYLDTVLSHVLGIEQALDVSLHQWDTEALYRAIDDRQSDNRGSASKSSRHSQSSGGQASKDEADSSAGSTKNDADGKQANKSMAQQQQSQHQSVTHGSVTHGSVTHRDGPRSHAARQLAATMIRDLIPAESETPETRTAQSMQWSERLLRAHTADAGTVFHASVARRQYGEQHAVGADTSHTFAACTEHASGYQLVTPYSQLDSQSRANLIRAPLAMAAWYQLQPNCTAPLHHGRCLRISRRSIDAAFCQ